MHLLLLYYESCIYLFVDTLNLMYEMFSLPNPKSVKPVRPDGAIECRSFW